MNDLKIQKLKELKDLYQSGALNQDEFETMKSNILSEESNPVDSLIEPTPVVETKNNSHPKRRKQHTKKKHKTRSFIILVFLLGLIGSGGYIYFYQQDNEKNSTVVSEKISISTSDSKPKSNKSFNGKTSSFSSESSKSFQDSDAVAMFHSLDQKYQLAAMYSFAALKEQSSDDNSWSDASVINADLNTEKMIVLSPVPGDVRIVLIDNYDETFNYQIYHVDSVIDEGKVTTTQLNSIAKTDTQLATWASNIRMKELDN